MVPGGRCSNPSSAFPRRPESAVERARRVRTAMACRCPVGCQNSITPLTNGFLLALRGRIVVPGLWGVKTRPRP